MAANGIPFRQLTGLRFGRLTVTEKTELRGVKRFWLCRCDCGTEKWIQASPLVGGSTVSCGCRQREAVRERGDALRTHGMKKTSTYHIWVGMLQRCRNPAAPDFGRYGGRGILVCERWLRFENFLADMGERPAKLTLDRIDGDKGYSPENCRWASYAEQIRNSSTAKMVTLNGRTQCITDWRRELGLSSSGYAARLSRGWSIERALSTPSTGRTNWPAGRK